MVGPGLALDSSISLENSDGGQCDNILLVFSLAGRHLLWGLPVLLCSWAWTLRVVDVLCCGASVRLRMREVILLLKLCAWRVRVQSSVLWRRSVLLIKGLLLIRLGVLLLACHFPWQKLLCRGRVPASVLFRYHLVLR